jgi:hypothetical protein
MTAEWNSGESLLISAWERLGCRRVTGGSEPYDENRHDAEARGGQQPFLPVVAGRRRPKPAGPGAVVLGYCKRHFAFSPSWGIIGCCIRQSSARV